MIFFGHLGPTTALVNLLDNKLLKKKNNSQNIHIDYRMVMVGSVLPDLIDKPIGAFIFRGVFHNSRIFCHTLLFSVVLMLIGVFSANKTKNSTNNFMILGFCSLIHQLLDSMWLFPGIFYWPLFGIRFPERPEGNWAAEGITRLLTDPAYFIPEIAGFIIMLYFFIRLIKKGKIKNFLSDGQL